ncbi:protein ACCELERATED CELL DEATH 6-like [Syzygium oleosum]|uniref:protein ACCELERATED CELL DEATH 6-like n=1 Tax=Syzygium oleosum TaxID=219896 RepID=UPI0011D1CA2E|nr:protein ACCELERATED CELL DEATH 6-like [Syzygium oleosum]
MGWTPLHYAACFGNVKAVRLLLQHDTSVAYCSDKEGESALHIAAFRGHIKVIDELVKSCPDACDMINTKRQTALHAAVIGGKTKVVEHILGMPNLEDLIDEQDTDGNTALHLAVLHKKYHITDILAKDRRVNCFATNKEHLTALDIFFAREEVKFRYSVYRALRGYHGFPVIQDWASEYVKTRLDKQSFKGQPAGSITTGSNTPSQENSDSSMKRVIDLEVLVAAFIATATFAAAFTMPGGYISDGPNQGMATLAGRAAFTTFVITNTIAFSFSATALFLQYDTSTLSDRKRARFTVSAGTFIYLAMLAMVLAFASGTYVVLTRTTGLAIVPWVVFGCVGSHYIVGFIQDPKNRAGTLYLYPYIFLPEGWREYGIH